MAQQHRAGLQRTSALDLAVRTRKGTLAYPLGGLLLAASTGVLTRFPVLSAVGVGLLLVLGLVRFRATGRMPSWYEEVGERAVIELITLTALQCAVFSVAIPAVILHFGPSREAAVAVLFGGGSLAAGTSSLAPRRHAYWAWAVCLLVPVLGSWMYAGSREEWPLFATFLLYVGFMLREGGLANAAYQREIQSAALAEHRAAELDALSRLDALTGARNRRDLIERLELEWRAVHRAGDPIAILIVDVDRFKGINDSLGHLVGDAVLRTVAGVLGARARRPHDTLARYGGDEFVLLLPDVGPEAAKEIATDLVRRAREISGPDVAGASVTISVGVWSGVPPTAAGWSSAFDAADSALLRAKREGRDRAGCAWEG